MLFGIYFNSFKNDVCIGFVWIENIFLRLSWLLEIETKDELA